jgi:hypothetical protein
MTASLNEQQNKLIECFWVGVLIAKSCRNFFVGAMWRLRAAERAKPNEHSYFILNLSEGC